MNCPNCGHTVPQMTLADIFTGPKHRTTDPDTSRLAALRNVPRRTSQRARILRCVITAGHNGMTYSELAATLGIPGVSVSTRISELVAGEWLIPTSHTRPTENGGDAAVVIASAKALEAFYENAPAGLASPGADHEE